MKTLLATTILSGMLVFPAFAQMSSGDMSCADFTAMDSSGQMEAVTAMQSGTGAENMEAMESEDAMAPEESMESESAMGSDDMASGEMTELTAESVAEACADHPDMMIQEAMQHVIMGN